jgi:hypothetical protein
MTSGNVGRPGLSSPIRRCIGDRESASLPAVQGALLSSNDCGSSVERTAKLHPLCRRCRGRLSRASKRGSGLGGERDDGWRGRSGSTRRRGPRESESCSGSRRGRAQPIADNPCSAARAGCVVAGRAVVRQAGHRTLGSASRAETGGPTIARSSSASPAATGPGSRLLAELDTAGYSSVSQLSDFIAGASFIRDIDRVARRSSIRSRSARCTCSRTSGRPRLPTGPCTGSCTSAAFVTPAVASAPRWRSW